MTVFNAEEVKKCLEDVVGEDKEYALWLLEWAINKRSFDLEEHDKQIRAEVIEEYVKTFCDKDNQAGFLVLSKHTHSWNAYAKYVAEQLKEQNK